MQLYTDGIYSLMGKKILEKYFLRQLFYLCESGMISDI
jgi:hypothetical protein